MTIAMTFVTRCVRATAGVVLLGVLAATVTASAAGRHQATDRDARTIEQAVGPVVGSLGEATATDTGAESSFDALRAVIGVGVTWPADVTSKPVRDAMVDRTRTGAKAGAGAKQPERNARSGQAGAQRRTPQATAPQHKQPERSEGPASPASPTPPPAAWDAFDQVLRDRLGHANNAVSVAVAIDGKIVHRWAFGERVPGQSATPDDRFRIASLSKVFAATAALRLVDRGELELDGPATGRVADALGVMPADPRAGHITLRQLLGHTSGFAGYDHEFFRGGTDSCHSAAEVAFGRSLSSDPGTSHRYSNMNYCMLGLLLEQVTGKPYDRVLRDEVLAPLGIDGMRVAGTFDVGLRDVRHRSSPGRNYMETLGAAGSWLATPSDVVTLLDSLDPAKSGWHPLSNQSLAHMKAPSRLMETAGRGADFAQQTSGQWYGLGLMVFGDGSYGHTGTLESTHAMGVARGDGITWAITVSGETPRNSFDLRPVIDSAFGAAKIG